MHIEEYGTTATISKNKHNDQNEPLLNNQNMKTNEKEALIYTNNGKELKKLFKIQYYKDEKSLKCNLVHLNFFLNILYLKFEYYNSLN